MSVVRTVAELRTALRERETAPADGAAGIGLVPTMGALHEGHLSLVRAARSENATVVISIFVNPTQFTEAADLAAYPRDEARDVELAVAAGADLVFAPSAHEMYPHGFATTVRVTGTLTETLEGAVRGAAHFDGVATVVAKLLLAARAEAAYFGAKDAQQVLVVQRMVADLGIPTRIVVCPTSRDVDGLAQSSRNALLSAAERGQALAIPGALAEVEAAAAEEGDPRRLRAIAERVLGAAGITPEYLAFVDPLSLEPVPEVTGPTLFALAARVGDVRLIDNVLLRGGVPGVDAPRGAPLRDRENPPTF